MFQERGCCQIVLNLAICWNRELVIISPCSAHSSNSMRSLALQLPTPWRPRTPCHTVWSRPTLAFKSPMMVSFSCCQYKVYPAPCSVRDPSSAKRTPRLRASFCATSAERRRGRSASSESCIVQIFQHANLRLVFGLCFISCFLPLVWDTH